MRESTVEFGARGEDAACAYLREQGFEILTRNWRSPHGEIDVIARERDQAVIVEVKTRSGTGFGHPFESIGRDKASRLRRLAALWAKESGWTMRSIRIDAIGILWPRGVGYPTIEHLIGVA